MSHNQCRFFQKQHRKGSIELFTAKKSMQRNYTNQMVTSHFATRKTRHQAILFEIGFITVWLLGFLLKKYSSCSNFSYFKYFKFAFSGLL